MSPRVCIPPTTQTHSMKLGERVAGPLPTRYGAKKCYRCGNPIDIGAMVVKLAVGAGVSTRHGQGPGRWVHEACEYPNDEIMNDNRSEAHQAD